MALIYSIAGAKLSRFYQRNHWGAAGEFDQADDGKAQRSEKAEFCTWMCLCRGRAGMPEATERAVNEHFVVSFGYELLCNEDSADSAN